MDIAEKPDDTKGVLVVFIDDLDRCPGEKIIKVLETVKLFMDKESCVFVMGAANDIIQKSLEKSYGEDAVKFMDKIVQVTFNLPNIPQKDFETFLDEINFPEKEIIIPHIKSIIFALGCNPRRVKRFLNNLSLLDGLLQNKGVQIAYETLLYWNIIDYAHPTLRDDIKDNPRIIKTLKEKIQEVEKEQAGSEEWEVPREALEKIPLSLQPYIEKRELVMMIKKFDIQPAQLELLTTFSGIIESSEEAIKKEAKDGRVEFDKMVKIPAGGFLYGEEKSKKNIADPFLIDVYPVTNSQFEKFVKEGGYIQKEYWSKEGLQWKKKLDKKQPEFWADENLNHPDHPVVGVCFYEAQAYASWAGKRLPTESEWEKAARGTDGSIYPWGDTFDESKCNTRESGLKTTSRVTRYPDGVSPYGCYDMVGNVWEWTESFYDTKLVLRGGSWSGGSGVCRCAVRNFGSPYGRNNNNIGFRCARTLTL